MTTSKGGWIIAAAAAAVIFALDLFIPLGIAVPMLYVIPVFLTWLVPGPRITVVIASCSVTLTVLGIILFPGEFTTAVAADRVLASTLEVVIAWLLIRQKQSARQIAAAQQVRNEGEERLRESELRFRTLVERIGDVFWISDPTSRKLVYVSQKFEDIWGRSSNELYDHFETWLEAIHEDDRPRVAKDFFEHILIGTYDAEYRIVRPDGTIRWIHDRGKSLGIGTLVAGMAEDITERKQTEEALHKSEEQYRTLFESIDEGFCVIEVVFDKADRPLDYQFLEVNPAFEQQTGIADAVGRRMREIAPAHEEHWFEIYGRVAMTGEPARFQNQASALRRWYDVYAFRIGTPEQRRVAILFNDITDRKRAEEQLQESEERLRLALEGADLGSWDVNVRTGEARWNHRHAMMQGYEQHNGPVSIQKWKDRVHPDDLDRIMAAVERAKLQRGLFTEEHRVMLPDNGTERWLSLYGRFAYDDTGAPVRFSGVSLDITDRKRIEEGLLELNETLEQRVVKRTAELTGLNERLQAEITERTKVETALRYREALTGAFLENSATIAWMKDAEGRYVYLSPNYQRRFKVRFEDWRGKTDFELRPREVAKQFRQNDLAVLQQDSVIEVVEEAKNMDGSLSWWLNHRFPYQDQSGKRYVGGLGVEITERKEAEEALRQKGELIELSFEPIFVRTVDGVIIEWNYGCQRLYGYSSAEARGIISHDLLKTQFALPLADIEGQLLAEGNWAGELHHRTRDGREVIVESRWQLIETGQHRIVLEANRDITERKRAEEALHQKQGELHQSQVQLQDLTAKLFTAQDDERRRIARELHDDHVQRLAALALDLHKLARSRLKPVGQARAAITQSAGSVEHLTLELQQFSHRLHPATLSHLGLEATLHDHVEEFGRRTGLKTDVQVHEVPAKLSDEHALCLFRVLQECLQNVHKHARASQVFVKLLGTRCGIGLCVRDDGCGFESRQDMPERRRGLGLISLAERLEALDGTFHVRTRPGGGTEVHAWIPSGPEEVSAVSAEGEEAP